jgi:nicotinate-nucleotide adenylyltransferase
MKKIGLFGGTFDPIHLGHINMALALKEIHGLDHVFFVIANRNPLKPRGTLAAPHHRLNMVKIALRAFLGCSPLSLELRRPGPSYMIDTVLELKKKKKFQDCRFYLLMGEDLIEELPRWKDIHMLLHFAPPLIAKRKGGPKLRKMKDAALESAIRKGLTETPTFDISATDIRKRCSSGRPLGHMLDKNVLRYIKNHHLYSLTKDNE